MCVRACDFFSSFSTSISISFLHSSCARFELRIDLWNYQRVCTHSLTHSGHSCVHIETYSPLTVVDDKIKYKMKWNIINLNAWYYSIFRIGHFILLLARSLYRFLLSFFRANFGSFDTHYTRVYFCHRYDQANKPRKLIEFDSNRSCRSMVRYRHSTATIQVCRKYIAQRMNWIEIKWIALHKHFQIEFFSQIFRSSLQPA